MRNQTHATFEGLYRKDHKDYPETALREALLNAIVHREYAYSASTLISVYSNRIEMVSLGGLAHGISLDDILLGLSVCRNQKLANVFYRLELIEAYGTGMLKIQNAYEGCGTKPEIIASSNAFKIVLPIIPVTAESGALALNPSEAALVLDKARAQGFITRQEVEELLNVKTATASRLLKSMVEQKLIRPVGRGKNTRYAP